MLGVVPECRDQVRSIARVAMRVDRLDRRLDVDGRRLVEGSLGVDVIIDNDGNDHDTQTKRRRLWPLGLFLQVANSVVTNTSQGRQTL